MRELWGRSVILFFLAALFFIFPLRTRASIVMKIVIVNPSGEQSQKVPVKVYLPKEAKPEDVLDRGDLEIAYDSQQGSYYFYGEYELKPLEVLEKEMEFRDIWVIEEAELESLRLEAGEVKKLLKNTQFAGRVDFLYNTIVTKLNEIRQRQKTSSSNPEEHISGYRHNAKLLESVKMDLTVIRSMLSKGRPFPASMIWKVMIFIIVFLGILGLSFYLLWHKQAKYFASESIPGGEPSGEKKPFKEYEAEEKDKEVGSEDIEKILGD